MKPQPKASKPFPVDQQLTRIRYSPDGKLLFGATFEGSIRRWDASGNLVELTPIVGHDGWVSAIEVHGDGKRIFGGDSWGRLACWPLAEKDAKPIWEHKTAHDGWLRAVAISPDGKTLASVGRDRRLRMASTADGKAIASVESPEDLMCVLFAPDGQSIIAGDSRGVLRQWPVAGGKPARELDATQMHLRDRLQDVGGARCLVFNTKGDLLVVGGSKPKTGGFVEGTNLLIAFDWATGKMKHTYLGANDKEGYIHDLAWHPDGFAMAACSGQPGQGRLFFHVPEEATPFFSAAVANAHSLAMRADGKRIVVSATNANSSGNGRPKGDQYPGNFSPLHIFDLPS